MSLNFESPIFYIVGPQQEWIPCITTQSIYNRVMIWDGYRESNVYNVRRDLYDPRLVTEDQRNNGSFSEFLPADHDVSTPIAPPSRAHILLGESMRSTVHWQRPTNDSYQESLRDTQTSSAMEANRNQSVRPEIAANSVRPLEHEARTQPTDYQTFPTPYFYECIIPPHLVVPSQNPEITTETSNEPPQAPQTYDYIELTNYPNPEPEIFNRTTNPVRPLDQLPPLYRITPVTWPISEGHPEGMGSVVTLPEMMSQQRPYPDQHLYYHRDMLPSQLVDHLQCPETNECSLAPQLEPFNLTTSSHQFPRENENFLPQITGTNHPFRENMLPTQLVQPLYVPERTTEATNESQAELSDPTNSNPVEPFRQTPRLCVMPPAIPLNFVNPPRTYGQTEYMLPPQMVQPMQFPERTPEPTYESSELSNPTNPIPVVPFSEIPSLYRIPHTTLRWRDSHQPGAYGQASGIAGPSQRSSDFRPPPGFYGPPAAASGLYLNPKPIDLSEYYRQVWFTGQESTMQQPQPFSEVPRPSTSSAVQQSEVYRQAWFHPGGILGIFPEIVLQPPQVIPRRASPVRSPPITSTPSSSRSFYTPPQGHRLNPPQRFRPSMRNPQLPTTTDSSRCTRVCCDPMCRRRIYIPRRNSSGVIRYIRPYMPNPQLPATVNILRYPRFRMSPMCRRRIYNPPQEPSGIRPSMPNRQLPAPMDTPRYPRICTNPACRRRLYNPPQTRS